MAEEEQCEDLVLFLKLLSHLTTKDYLSFVPLEDSSSDQGKVEPVDVVVTGINIVLPLMSEETLKVKSLMLELFHCEILYQMFLLNPLPVTEGRIIFTLLTQSLECCALLVVVSIVPLVSKAVSAVLYLAALHVPGLL